MQASTERRGEPRRQPLHVHEREIVEKSSDKKRAAWDDWLRKIDEAVNTSVLERTRGSTSGSLRQSQQDAGRAGSSRSCRSFSRTERVLQGPAAQRGIHCASAWRIVAEAHWDGPRNTIAQFYGRRRYVLVDPTTCDMYLLAKNLRPDRSEVDWSNPDSWEKFPDFPTMPAHEVVQRPGDFLPADLLLALREHRHGLPVQHAERARR